MTTCSCLLSYSDIRNCYKCTENPNYIKIANQHTVQSDLIADGLHSLQIIGEIYTNATSKEEKSS